MNEKPALVEAKAETKLILMSAWIALMFLYLYCDYFTLYRPGMIESISGGSMGFMKVSQLSLFAASLLMAIPSLMTFASALLPARINRGLNLAAGALYFLVNAGNLLGETWAYYYLFCFLELGLTLLIFALALRWPRRVN